MKRSNIQRVAVALLSSTLAAPILAHAFVGELLGQVLPQLVRGGVELSAANSRWGDLQEAYGKASKDKDFSSAYEIVKSGYLSRYQDASNNELDVDCVVRLKALKEYAVASGKQVDYREFLISQERQLLSQNERLIPAWYMLLRANIASNLKYNNEFKRFQFKAIEYLDNYSKVRHIEMGKADLGIFITQAKVKSNELKARNELELFGAHFQLLNNSAVEASISGRHSEALYLANEAVSVEKKQVEEIKSNEYSFVKLDENDRKRFRDELQAVRDLYAYKAGEKIQLEQVLEGFRKLPPSPYKSNQLAYYYLKLNRPNQSEFVIRSKVISGETNGNEGLIDTPSIVLMAESLLAQGDYSRAISFLRTTIDNNKKLTDKLVSEYKGKLSEAEIININVALGLKVSIANLYLTEALQKINEGTTDVILPLSLSALNGLNDYIKDKGSIPYAEMYMDSDKWEKLMDHQVMLLSKRDEREAIFNYMQIVGVNQVSQVVAEATARISTGDDEIAKVLRKQQDVKLQLAKLNDLLNPSKSTGEKLDATVISKLRNQISQLEGIDEAVRREISEKHPNLKELSSSRILKLGDIQQILKPKEAVLGWHFGKDQAVLIAIKRDSVKLFPLPIAKIEISRLIETLLRQLNPSSGTINRFEPSSSRALYASIIKPAEAFLADISHLHIMANSLLSSLPLSVLLTNDYASSDLANAPWLVNRFSTSIVPSISSFQFQRSMQMTAQQMKPFIGFGDPLFADHPGTTGSTRNIATRGFNARNVLISTQNASENSQVTSTQQGADKQLLMSVPSLPETADELISIANSLGASSDSVYLRETATESNIKKQTLNNYKIVAFATHGVVSNEIQGISEPALLLTPPKITSDEDDGVLTASEVATLKMNADWVLLSACNTASSDGKPGADGLSGLAKAFSYAGARSMMVSHWSIPSESTALLTSKTFELFTKNSISKSEAHRQAMQSLIHSKGGKYAHPTFWAPFSIVGDGMQTTSH